MGAPFAFLVAFAMMDSLAITINLISIVLFLLISGAWFFIAKKKKDVQEDTV